MTSFDAKLKMVDAVAGVMLEMHKSDAAKWRRICGSLERQNRYRNKLAHGYVVSMIYEDQKGGGVETFLAPYFYARRDKGTTPTNAAEGMFDIARTIVSTQRRSSRPRTAFTQRGSR